MQMFAFLVGFSALKLEKVASVLVTKATEEEEEESPWQRASRHLLSLCVYGRAELLIP